MRHAGLIAWLCLALQACSANPLRFPAPGALAGIAGPAEQYVVAGVDNAALAPGGHAGSTPRAYDALGAYGPSARARQTLRNLERDYGLREVAVWPIDPLHMHCAVLAVPPGADRAAVLAALGRDARVRLAQPLQTFATQTQTYNDPYVGLQRGFQQMDVADAHPWSRGAGVRVAIIDTGADTGHPELRAAIVQTANFVDADERQFRRDRHGTEVAGIIAAAANNREGIVGIAPDARLMVFKACWQLRADADAAQCNSFTLAQALVAALDAHAQVVNLSLVGPEDPLLHDLISEGLRRGMVFVGASSTTVAGAGNPLFRRTEVIEVASSGEAVANPAALYAPGREILTLLPGGHYDFASGSSLATAHITGAVALLLALNPRLSAGAAYRLLRGATAHVASDKGPIDVVDACAAVAALASHGGCPSASVDGNRLAEGNDAPVTGVSTNVRVSVSRNP